MKTAFQHRGQRGGAAASRRGPGLFSGQTAGRGRGRAPRGFTILEVVIAISLMALLIALAVGSTVTLSHQRMMEQPMNKVREFAKRARNLAILEQRPYQVVIMPNSVAIYSLISADGGQGVFGAAEAAQPRGQVDYYEWEPEVVMSVRRWRAREFMEPSRQVWIFERSGLCEPLAVRVDSEHGFIEMAFNALDAHVEDTASEIR